jgi:hypothetical protein
VRSEAPTLAPVVVEVFATESHKTKSSNDID